MILYALAIRSGQLWIDMILFILVSLEKVKLDFIQSKLDDWDLVSLNIFITSKGKRWKEAFHIVTLSTMRIGRWTFRTRSQTVA